MEGLKRYICPICEQIPRDEIFHCRNGHWFCEACIPALKNKCRQCHVSIRPPYRSRNRIMEEYLDHMEFECPFAEKGCVKKMKRGKLTDHRNKCNFNKTLQICECFNLDGRCDFELSYESLKDLPVHWRENHGFRTLDSTDDVILNKFNFKNFFHAFDAFAKSIVFTMLQFGTLGKQLLFVTHRKDYNVSWIFLDISPEGALTDGTQMHVELWSEQTPTISWKVPVFSVLDAQKHVYDMHIVKTNMDLLKGIKVPPLPEQGELDYNLNFRLICKK